MKSKKLFPIFIFVWTLISPVLQAQSLPPSALSYERTGRTSVQLAWMAPNSDQSYPLYDLNNWIPQTFFYTRSATPRMQESVLSDGKYIYSSSVDNAEGQLMKFDLNGNFLETFVIDGLPLIYKMTYDGTFFYATKYDSPGIYQIDMDKKELVSIIPTPVNLFHICYIPSLDEGRGGFEAGVPTKGYYFRKDGTYLSDGPDFSAYTGTASTAYYNGKLYAFCQPPGSLRTIVEYDVKTALPTGKTLDLATLIGQAGIAESQMADDLSFYEYPAGIQKALVTSYYTTAYEYGTIVSIFEAGKRPLPAGLQGYNVYKDNVKQNPAPLGNSVYAYTCEKLEEETDYACHVTAIYDGNETASPNVTVHLPASNHLPLAEDFSSGNFHDNFWEIIPKPNLPAWKITTTTPALGDALPGLAYNYTYSRDYEQTFVSKPLKSSAPIILLRYDVACNPGNQYNERLNVEIEVNENWQLISSENSSLITSRQTKQWDITSLVQDKDFRLRFRVSGEGGNASYYWYLDNIRIWSPEYVTFGGTVLSIDLPEEGAQLKLVKADDTGIVYETVSGNNGRFLFPQVEKGTYLLTISKAGKTLDENPGYRIDTEETNALIAIPGSRIQMDVSPIQILMGQDKSKNIRLAVTNAGNDTLKWRAETKYTRLGTGNEIGRSDIAEPPLWEAKHGFDLENPREKALVFHNNRYYALGERTYAPSTFLLKEYDAMGELLYTYTIATPDYILQGLVSDGGDLYEITAAEDRGEFSPSLPGRLIPIDLENGTVDESRAIVTDFNEIPSLIYAVYDPVNDGFYAGSSHEFYRIDRSGKVQKTYDIIYAYARQIALDTFSEGGPYMWLFCEKNIAGHGGNNDRANILQYSLKEEKLTNLVHSPADVPDYDATLSVTPAGFFASTAIVPGYFVLGGALTFADITMNVRTSQFIYQMFPYKNWISLPAKTGEITPGQSAELSVEISSHALEDGEEQEATLIIHSNSPGEAPNIPVKLKVDNSAETNCYAPQNLTAVLTEQYEVRLNWSLPAEAPPVKNFHVFRNGKRLADKLTESLFVDTVPGMGLQTYTVKASYESGCESYDTEPVEIQVTNPGIVAPAGELTASIVNKKNVFLKWKAPQYGTGFWDDFETYPAFSIDGIGNWKVVDGDKSWTYANTNLFYLHQGKPMAFMVFNPSACSPPADIDPCDDKKQFLACFGANVSKLSNNDWLISPELHFSRPFALSFMAKTYQQQYGFEKINIAYSVSGNNPEDFLFVNGNTPVNIGDVWWRYSYEIPAEAKFVAIQCVTTNGYILFIDNIYVGHPEYYSELLGYNVYRNGQKLNTALLQTPAYADPNLENGTYAYEIEALFANGTSSKATAEPLTVDYSFEATPPRELQANRTGNAIQLSWLAPSSLQYKDLRYDSGIPANSMGGVEEEQYIAVRWSASDLEAYAGCLIKGVQFHIAEPVLFAAPFLCEDGILVAGGEELQVEAGKYTTVFFDEPVVIRPETEYIAGYSCLTDGAGYYPVSHDAGPAIAGKGDLVSTNGFSWFSAGQIWGSEFDVNWNIALLVELDTENEFQGYHVYRNNTRLNTQPFTGLTCTDTDDGTKKEYYVTAVYRTAGEKSSNHVIVDALRLDTENPSFVTVYPNPAGETVYVKGDYDNLHLLSPDGKEIRRASFSGETITRIDVRNLPAGIYLLGVEKAGFTEYYKVIVNGKK
jgi:hypothetical protein